MKIPKIIERFIFDSMTTSFTYKGNKMFSATYINPNNGVKMKIFTYYDEQLDKQKFGISIKESMITGIPTFDRLLEVAFELVRENESFLGNKHIEIV